jgi:Uma2 family endonuclease
MSLLITDPALRKQLIAERRAIGADHHDEVWDGVYVMSPLASDEHQRLVMRLASILDTVIGIPGLGDVRPGVNVSDRVTGWKRNYRVPDVVVRLSGGRARILETHWYGGPDFVIEVVSPGDRSREKLAFYATIGVRELLLIDRELRYIELYALQARQLVPVGVLRAPGPQQLVSEVVPLTFRLRETEARRRIEVALREGGQTWLV